MSDLEKPEDPVTAETTTGAGDGKDNDETAAPAPPPAAPPTLPADIRLDASLQAASDKDRKKQTVFAKYFKKYKITEKQLIGYGSMIAAFAVFILMLMSCQPVKGPMAYGICSTFLELNAPYPHTLRYLSVEGSRTTIRIYFTSIDPFGQYNLQSIECKFGPDPVMGMRVTQIAFNPQKIDSNTRLPIKLVDQKTLEAFNMTLPAIIEAEPYLNMPPDWENPLLRNNY